MPQSCCEASRINRRRDGPPYERTPIYCWQNMRGYFSTGTHIRTQHSFWPPYFLLSMPDLASAVFAPAGLDPAAFAGPGFAPAASALSRLARSEPLRAALPEPLRFGVPALPDLCVRQTRWMRRAAHVRRCHCMVARFSSSSA